MNEHHNEILKCMKVTKRSLTIIEAITCVSSVSQSVRHVSSSIGTKRGERSRKK